LLRRLGVRGYKSIREAEINLPQLTVLFGPNAAGKSNLLDAIQSLSRLASERTVSEALSEPIRGYAIEAFSFSQGGLSALLSQPLAGFTLEADLVVGKECFRYRVGIAIQPATGSLSVQDEYLTALKASGEPKGSPAIGKVEGELRIRRRTKPGHPRQEPVGQNHTILSDPRLGGSEYRQIARCREDLLGWRVYYLDPRVAMRSAKPPTEVVDIGVLGENIAPFMYRLKAENPAPFAAVKRTLRSIIPSIEDLEVDLDKRRGTLDILIRQDDTDYSTRIVSEGTLRVLALCCIAVNPWGGSLIAFEEPENGVHPRRIELIAKLLTALALEHGRQVIVTTHSPLFCDAILRIGEDSLDKIALLNVRHDASGTVVTPFSTLGPLFKDKDIAQRLTAPSEDGLFEHLVMRGLLDA